ncbi:hypothetical protein HOU03_gp390 [Caulobacter phage CcrSC]|uniref:Uncharacterized protein n=1 Tax=Caulobacter phage CcrSC TaxID=2283272 RepID=A0A385EG83_9CAUD|nr:hypothetical protein HOU03_gp390 [Caulobacter phage CcrSC]AXQ69878.1 hypothetical protein CcrSC_gp296 [Caulobacter phage CcrSC]
MTYTIKQALIALEHLTPSLPRETEDGEFETKPQADKSWGTISLARRLQTSKEAAKIIEDDLVEDGLMIRTPGYQGNPRFNLTDAGHAYLVLGRKGGLTAEQIVKRIPRGPCAADPISMRGTLLKMEFLGIVSSADGGQTYSLVS